MASSRAGACHHAGLALLRRRVVGREHGDKGVASAGERPNREAQRAQGVMVPGDHGPRIARFLQLQQS